MTIIKFMGAVAIVAVIAAGFNAARITIRTRKKLRACPGAMRFYWTCHDLHEREKVQAIRRQYSLTAASRYVVGSPAWNEGGRKSRRPF